jgi:hypothetical protein
MTDILSVAAPQPGVKPTNFQFSLSRFPNMTFMAQVAAVPAVSFDRIIFNTPVQDVKLPSTNLNFEDFEVTLLLDKNLQAYAEMFAWLRALSIRDSRDDYKNFIATRQQQLGIKTHSRLTEETAQGTLLALDANSNPTFKFTFDNMFPVSIGKLDFDTESANIEYLKCDIVFAYTGFDIEPVVGGSLTNPANVQNKYGITMF